MSCIQVRSVWHGLLEHFWIRTTGNKWSEHRLKGSFNGWIHCRFCTRPGTSTLTPNWDEGAPNQLVVKTCRTKVGCRDSATGFTSLNFSCTDVKTVTWMSRAEFAGGSSLPSFAWLCFAIENKNLLLIKMWTVFFFLNRCHCVIPVGRTLIT